MAEFVNIQNGGRVSVADGKPMDPSVWRPAAPAAVTPTEEKRPAAKRPARE